MFLLTASIPKLHTCQWRENKNEKKTESKDSGERERKQDDKV